MQGEVLALLVMLSVFFAINASRTVVTYKALSFDADSFDIGIVAAAYSFLPLFLGIPLGLNIDRFGGGLFLLAGATLSGLSSLLLLGAPALIGLIIGQAFLGMSHTTIAISVQSLAATVGPEEGRDRRFAHLGVVAATGHFVGPLIAAWTLGGTDAGGGLPDTAPTFAVAAAISVIGVAVAVLFIAMSRRTGAVHRPAPHRVRFRESLFRPGVIRILGASLASLVATDLLIAYLPVVAQSRGVSAAFVGVLLSFAAGTGLVSRIGLVPLLTRFSGRTILLGGLSLAALGTAGVVFASKPWSLVVTVGAVGLGVGVAAPIVGSWMAGTAPLGERGTSLALRTTFNRLGQVLVPVSFGALASLLGPASVFGAIAGLLVVAVGGLRRVKMYDSAAP